MSIEATKWARLADVEKSSSKLVLLNLAMLVHYKAEDWTVFASIDYLANVTHLNRKTVIEALGRLRELGAIQDTGRRAGDNRSSIVYRLCPNAVPLVDLPAASNAKAGNVKPSPQPTFDWGQPRTAAVSGDECSSGTSMRESVSIAETDLMVEDSSQERASQSALPITAAQTAPARAGQRPEPFRRSNVGLRPRPRAAGAAATRLPAGWTLPDRWRTWTVRERPHWTAEKIDAMTATFTAYMRSRPGEAGMSSDWFESWRLWVFREWEPKESRAPWHSTWSGIVAKGKSLGLSKAPNEPEAHFKVRVFQAAGMSLPR
ncbi:hypothetical protein [Bordetella petrii]|uniref:hypothetical protein n=1 Tax=Bordetella petrii TaxID=94624 RepID=UPI0012DF50C1|nr:hypothetical protein [Bordetella petrii]